MNSQIPSIFSDSSQKQIILCRNLIILFLVGSSIITASNYLILGISFRFFAGLSVIPLLLILLWVNNKGYYQVSGILLSIFIPILVFSINIMFKLNTTQELSYFEYITARILILSVLCIPFLIFDIYKDRYYLLLGVFVNFACLFLYDPINQYLGVDINLNQLDKDDYTYFLLILLISWIVLAFAFFILRYINHQVEAKLHFTNKELSAKQDEIQCQNEELLQQAEQITNINKELSKREQHTRSLNINLEQEVAKHTQALQDINRELDLFLYRSSHDLRRPLTTLMGLAEVARSSHDTDLLLDLMDKVNFTAYQMDKMLTKLRMVSDINGQDIELYPIKVRKIINYQIKSFSQDIKKANIQLDVNYDRNLEFYSNDTLLNAVFSNLLENAILFARNRSPYINIMLKKEQDFLWIHFEDNGQGIEKQYIGKIFDMYFRANEHSKGNGLGLYVVRKALEKLKGSIEVDSQYGEKTVFTLKIPLPEPPKPEANLK